MHVLRDLGLEPDIRRVGVHPGAYVFRLHDTGEEIQRFSLSKLRMNLISTDRVPSSFIRIKARPSRPLPSPGREAPSRRAAPPPRQSAGPAAPSPAEPRFPASPLVRSSSAATARGA